MTLNLTAKWPLNREWSHKRMAAQEELNKSVIIKRMYFCFSYGHSCFKYGHYNLLGSGCEKNITEAAKYYEKASYDKSFS